MLKISKPFFIKFHLKKNKPMRDLKTISQDMAEGKAVSPDEFATLLHNSKPAYLTFLIKNNVGGVNHVLRHKLGYTHELGFNPNQAKIGRICDLLIARNAEKEILTIVENTPIKIDKISPEVLTAIKLYKHV